MKNSDFTQKNAEIMGIDTKGRIQLAQEEYGYPSGPFFWPTSLSDLTRNDDEPGISSRKCIKIPCPQIFVWGVFFMYFQKSGSLENIPK